MGVRGGQHRRSAAARERIVEGMQDLEPIVVAHLFRPLNAELVNLLRSLTAAEWDAPTVAGQWTVKDVAAHLLDTQLRRLSMHRDGHEPPVPADAFSGGLAAFVNRMNAEGVAYLSRLSPRALIEMHVRFGEELSDFFESLDPHADAKWAVSWAGQEKSPMWFDIARELTERWHHQQQIRDATGRPPLYAPHFLVPVIDAFVRAIPLTYRDFNAAAGTRVVLRVTRECERTWTLVRDHDRWTLCAGASPHPAAIVTMTADKAWRLFTKGLTRETVEARIEGDARLAEPLLRTISIVA